MPPITRPTFDELKKREGPYLNAWGIYGKDNEYGQTNLITPEAIKRGIASVENGITINLNLPLLDKSLQSAFRGPVVQEV